MRTRRSGFTLIEMLVTVAIVAVLASAALPMGELVARRAKEQELKAALRQIRTAIDEYKRASDEGRVEKKAEDSGYPPSLDVLYEGVADMKDPAKKKIYFLRRVPRDPLATDPAIPAGQTWGLRSYASPPEAPLPGRDVFDVHSRAEGNGINGIRYREW